MVWDWNCLTCAILASSPLLPEELLSLFVNSRSSRELLAPFVYICLRALTAWGLACTHPATQSTPSQRRNKTSWCGKSSLSHGDQTKWRLIRQTSKEICNPNFEKFLYLFDHSTVMRGRVDTQSYKPDVNLWKQRSPIPCLCVLDPCFHHLRKTRRMFVLEEKVDGSQRLDKTREEQM